MKMKKYISKIYYQELGLYWLNKLRHWLATGQTGRIIQQLSLPPQTYKVNLGSPGSLSIILVGVGGTGSYLAQYLAQFAHLAQQRGEAVKLTFVDHDLVETKNVARQNFCPPEIGRPKALTLAWRYSAAYGLHISHAQEPFQAGILDRYRPTPSRYGTVTIVIGAVDNWQARRDIAEAIEARLKTQGEDSSHRLFWIDAGNERHAGQVVIGNSLSPEPLLSPLGYCVGLPLPHLQEPTLVRERDRPAPRQDEALSCAELTLLGEQDQVINKVMAIRVSWLLYRLLHSRDLDVMATYVEMESGGARSVPITKGRLVRIQQEPAPQQTPPQDITEAPDRPELDTDTMVCPNCPDRILVEGTNVVDGVTVRVLFCDNCGFHHQGCPECLGEIRRREEVPTNGEPVPAWTCLDCTWQQAIPEQYRGDTPLNEIVLDEVPEMEVAPEEQ